MNNKYFVGQKASTFKDLGNSDAVDGVILVVDDEHQYTAGNTDGYVWTMENPFGTQQMADDIFAELKGKSVKGYQADKAVLPPEAELGDGITVAGNYSQMAYRKVKFGPSHFSDISAPIDGDTAHEYQQNAPRETREIERKFASTRSYIEKKVDEILVGVEDEVNGVKGQLSLKVDKNDNNQVVSMLNIATDELNIKNNRFVLDSDNFKVSADGTVTMTGADVSGAVKAEEFKLQGITLAIRERELKAYAGYDVPPVDPGMSVDPPHERYEVFDIASSIGVHTERIYSDRAQLGYLGCGEGSFSSLVATKLRALEISEHGESLKDRYLRRNEGVWKTIKDGDGNNVTVLCWNV